jgi:hypothetical protein
MRLSNMRQTKAKQRKPDLRGRITINNTPYYLGRYPTDTAAAQAEDFVALWLLRDRQSASRCLPMLCRACLKSLDVLPLL